MKKAQLKMMETIGVLLVFFVMLIIGLVFWNAHEKSSLAQAALEQQKSRAVEHALFVSFLPEIQCSRGGLPDDNCIDQLKLGAFTILSSEARGSDFYFPLFGFSTIRVVQYYPQMNVYLLYTRTNEAKQSKMQTQIPVTLFNPQTREHYFAVLYVDYYY